MVKVGNLRPCRGELPLSVRRPGVSAPGRRRCMRTYSSGRYLPCSSRSWPGRGAWGTTNIRTDPCQDPELVLNLCTSCRERQGASLLRWPGSADSCRHIGLLGNWPLLFHSARRSALDWTAVSHQAAPLRVGLRRGAVPARPRQGAVVDEGGAESVVPSSATAGYRIRRRVAQAATATQYAWRVLPEARTVESWSRPAGAIRKSTPVA